MLRRLLTVLAVVVLAGAGLGAYVWRQQALAQAFQAALRRTTITRGTLISTVSATGSLVPNRRLNLYFSNTLPVAEINVSVGESVRPGQVLARLDSRALDLELSQAELNLAAARLALAQLQAPPRPEDLALAEASLRLANAQVYAASQGTSPEAVEIARLNLLLAQAQLNQTYATMDRLVAQGDLGWWVKDNFLQPQADQQVQEARIADERYHAAQAPPDTSQAVQALAAVEQAQVSLDRLKAGPRAEDLEIAQLRVAQAQAELEVAQHNLALARLEAPFAGTVAAVNLRPGEVALASRPAIVLADISQYFVDVQVDEIDVARVAPGQAVTVTVDAQPDAPLAGRVETVALTSSSAGGVTSYSVRVRLAGAPPAVRAGMTATAEIVVGEARDVLLIPKWAILLDRESGLAFAGVERGGRIEDVPITLGLDNDTHSEVTSGLAEGEVVVVDTTRDNYRVGSGRFRR